MNLSKETKLILVKAAQASAGTAITTDPVDTDGFDGVMFFGSLATVNAGNYAKARQGDASNMSDGADLAGTKIVPGNNGDSFLIDLKRPTKRFVDCQVVRAGANTAVGDIYALLYGPPRKSPSHQGPTINAELHVSPEEGAA